MLIFFTFLMYDVLEWNWKRFEANQVHFGQILALANWL